MPRQHSPAELIDGVRSGDRLQLARAITQVENETALARELISGLFRETGRAHIIGVTGAPGTGKSTLVTELALRYRAVGATVAIVAVDPTSPFTGGALLGDRVRMRKLSGDGGVFVRSMATRGNLGGLSQTSAEVILLLDAAGFDRIIVETVGVGQAEVAIAGTAHTTVVVEAPGMGDEVQAIKAGVLEIADILAVNKADRSGADRTVRALELALHMDSGAGRYLGHHGPSMALHRHPIEPSEAETGHTETDNTEISHTPWEVSVLKTVAADGTGTDALRQRIEAHRTWLAESGTGEERERIRLAHMLEEALRTALYRRIQKQIAPGLIADTLNSVLNRELDPYCAAENLLKSM